MLLLSDDEIASIKISDANFQTIEKDFALLLGHKSKNSKANEEVSLDLMLSKAPKKRE